MNMIQMAMEDQIYPDVIWPLYEKAFSMVEIPDEALKTEINDELSVSVGEIILNAGISAAFSAVLSGPNGFGKKN